MSMAVNQLINLRSVHETTLTSHQEADVQGLVTVATRAENLGSDYLTIYGGLG